jgi:cysteine desulfurase
MATMVATTSTNDLAPSRRYLDVNLTPTLPQPERPEWDIRRPGRYRDGAPGRAQGGPVKAGGSVDTMRRVYLDHASAWPLRPEAVAALADAQAIAWADATRGHAEARAAAELLARSAETVATALGGRADDVVWTSCGTEAVALAVAGTALAALRRGDPRRHLVVSAVEHSSVLRTADRLASEHGFHVTVVPVDRAGRVDPDQVAAALTPDTLVVHLQHANHEVGTIQPTHEVATACRAHGDVLLHVDACQTVGQVGLTLDQLGADLLTASGAKFGGARGTGFVVLGPRARLSPIVEGDDRQRRRRAGGLDVPGIAATAVALQVATQAMAAEHSTREALRRRLRVGFTQVDDVDLHGPLGDTHPGIVAASALYVDGEALVADLDRRGFAVHSGSSCASTSGEPSHVLVAMGGLTHGHVRVSVGPDTTEQDVDGFLAAWTEVVTDLRRHVRPDRSIP